MENSFSMLPNKVDNMMKQLNELASQLKTKENKVPPKKLLTIDEAIECLLAEGYLISKSTIYKKTSACTIPYRRFGNRLAFDRKELLEWCREKTISFQEQEAKELLIKKTQK